MPLRSQHVADQAGHALVGDRLQLHLLQHPVDPEGGLGAMALMWMSDAPALTAAARNLSNILGSRIRMRPRLPHLGGPLAA
jgi:hypothetical protein